MWTCFVAQKENESLKNVFLNWLASGDKGLFISQDSMSFIFKDLLINLEPNDMSVEA
jgi:hypothetical protein